MTMAGKKGKSGRPGESGRIYDFHFYYRFVPGEDPPELEMLLESIIEASGRKRRDILRAALLGGLNQAQETAANTEDSEISGLFNEMFDDF
jgi:hypothetical protein